MPPLRRLALVLLPLALLAGCGCQRAKPQSKNPPPPQALPARLTHVLCYHHLTDTPKTAYDVKPSDFEA